MPSTGTEEGERLGEEIEGPDRRDDGVEEDHRAHQRHGDVPERLQL